ncbi:hypothetical protein J7K27_07785 [Candidatus Bathyarchaeota archaeon]|nr:hypothetical protein [Candidatus Bathyarchaeota archaeon]
MDSPVKVLSCRVPAKLEVLVKEACAIGGYLNEADFIRSALREKLMREFPELYRQLTAKPAIPEPVKPESSVEQVRSTKLEAEKLDKESEAISEAENHGVTEKESEEMKDGLEDEGDSEWENGEKEDSNEWSDEEDDWDEFCIVKEENEH